MVLSILAHRILLACVVSSPENPYRKLIVDIKKELGGQFDIPVFVKFAPDLIRSGIELKILKKP
jgi:dihydroorotate dehydrogenase